MSMRRIHLTALLLAVACETPATTTAPVATSIAMSATEVSFTSLGDTIRLTAAVRDENGNHIDETTITWSSSDESIATVSTTGSVQSVRGGTAIITASAGEVSAATSVSVSVWESLSAGYWHTCGLTSEGDAYCWGMNSDSQLGDGTTELRSRASLVDGGYKWISIAGAGRHTCGVTSEGDAYCWGFNGYGQLGDGTTTDHREPTLVTGGHNWVSVSGGYERTCGLTSVGKAYCWGRNRGGQLGDGTTTNSSTPSEVSGNHTWVSIGANGRHACGLTSESEIYCWGNNYYGQLGNGSRGSSPVPTLVSGNLPWTSVTPGGWHTCGRTEANDAYCWGRNLHTDYGGQLGDGTTTNRTTPVFVTGWFSWASLGAGSHHTCGVTMTAKAYCWGHYPSPDFSLGDGVSTASSLPIPVGGNLLWMAFTGAEEHTCGLATTGEAYCWGPGLSGQLGNGSTVSSSVPVKVIR